MAAHVIDYDAVADRYGRRYALYDYAGVAAAVHRFIGASPLSVAEVGCGSGHWLALLGNGPSRLLGLDLSRRMLARARVAAPSAWLVRGRGVPLPLGDATFDRILCINALHHLGDRLDFFHEARRVLKAGGGLMTVGLDPHADRDRWWAYDYFETTRAFDLARLAPVRTIRGELALAAFSWAESFEADRIEQRMTVAEATASGVFDRAFTSQLMALSDDEYQRGLERIRAADAARAADGGVLELVTDLHVYATVAWL